MSPKDDGSSRSASRKRSKASHQEKSKASEAINSLDTGADLSNEAQNPAFRLASSAEALQRLADVAQYFRTRSGLNDIDAVRRIGGEVADREMEIRRLKDVIAEINETKSGKMANLEKEIAELKAGEDECHQERERCRKMRAQMDDEKAAAIAEIKQEHDKKWQKDRAKAQKRMDTEKAEKEEQFNKQAQRLEELNKGLSAENQQLKQDLLKVQEDAKIEKAELRWALHGLQGAQEKLTSELDEIKSEFPIEEHPVEDYSQRFSEIFTDIKNLSARYFQRLPELSEGSGETSEVEDFLKKELRERTLMFESESFLQTESADFVRSQIARSFISKCICNRIWQPFLTEGSFADHKAMNEFLERLSQNLLASDGRGESAWRVLTLRGIDALSERGESNKSKSLVDHILHTLKPLVAPGSLTQLKEDLTNIINNSISIWQVARRNHQKVIIETIPNADDKESWFAEDHIPQEGSTLSKRPPATTKAPMCLFPIIFQRTCTGELMVISQGSALFPDSYVWNQAIKEMKDDESVVEEFYREARSKAHARRPSYPNGPVTNAAGKGTGYNDFRSYELK